MRVVITFNKDLKAGRGIEGKECREQAVIQKRLAKGPRNASPRED
jgi:hypothetical protein